MLALLLAGRLSDQAPWNEYQPSTLAAIVEEHRAFLEDGRKGDYALEPGTDRHRVTVRYLGRPRSIPGSRRAFLGAWARSVRPSRPVQELFDEEILVKEGSREYWVPVQRVLMPALEKELDPGDQVELFVVFIGGRVPDWIFLVNEFDAAARRDRQEDAEGQPTSERVERVQAARRAAAHIHAHVRSSPSRSLTLGQ